MGDGVVTSAWSFRSIGEVWSPAVCNNQLVHVENLCPKGWKTDAGKQLLYLVPPWHIQRMERQITKQVPSATLYAQSVIRRLLQRNQRKIDLVGGFQEIFGQFGCSMSLSLESFEKLEGEHFESSKLRVLLEQLM
jgi:hypothetical protein